MRITKAFQPHPLPRLASAGLLLVRLVAGLAFMFHGYGKIQNPLGWMGADSSIPGLLQALAAIAEFGGGMAWMLGALTPLASFGLACTMVGAVWLHAVVIGDPFVPQGPGGSYELASIYLCFAVLLLLTGPGRYSLDSALFGERAPATPLPLD
jgi:putative oxidoreductase